MKKYPLEIENVGGDTYILMSRGHHDFKEFMTAVKESYNWGMSKPEHVWCKTTPAPKDSYYNSIFTFVEEGTRGSWPATYCFEAYGEDVYKVDDSE